MFLKAFLESKLHHTVLAGSLQFFLSQITVCVVTGICFYLWNAVNARSDVFFCVCIHARMEALIEVRKMGGYSTYLFLKGRMLSLTVSNKFLVCLNSTSCSLAIPGLLGACGGTDVQKYFLFLV